MERAIKNQQLWRIVDIDRLYALQNEYVCESNTAIKSVLDCSLKNILLARKII